MAKKLGISGKAIYIATVVAILGVVGGAALASVLTSTSVSEAANFYQASNGGAPGYSTSTMTLKVATSPGTCTSGTVVVTALTSAGATGQIILSSSGGGGTCASGDFAEEFQIPFSTTTTSLSQPNTFTITTQVGGGSVVSNNEQVTQSTAATAGTYTDTVNVFVDYGSDSPPSTGVSTLDLVIQ